MPPKFRCVFAQKDTPPSQALQEISYSNSQTETNPERDLEFFRHLMRDTASRREARQEAKQVCVLFNQIHCFNVELPLFTVEMCINFCSRGRPASQFMKKRRAQRAQDKLTGNDPKVLH